MKQCNRKGLISGKESQRTQSFCPQSSLQKLRTYLDWCDELCPHVLSGHVVVMDNLNSHKSTQVHQLITATGAKPLDLPRYPPDFNPIEMLWSVLKSFVRQFKTHSLPVIQIVVKTFFLLLDKCFVSNWFTKCCYCFP